MLDLSELEIKNFICNETSTFALKVIDLETFEVIYKNAAMQEFMLFPEQKKCWSAVYGQSERCSWCKIKDDDIKEFKFEYFNEKNSRWYQVNSKPATLRDGRKVLISIAIDITIQKEVQGRFITTQVKLVQQTEALKEAQEKLKELASVDYMTGLYNRRHFLQVITSLLELAKRNKRDSSLVMIDIDKFKAINDTYGHNVGDKVIIALAELMQKRNRQSDIICRWGGEEFLIFLPETSIEGALIVAQKFREDAEQLCIHVDDTKEVRFSVSLGVTQINSSSDESIEISIDRADKALYSAKESGRNRVCSLV